jgi:hypothetical protein
MEENMKFLVIASFKKQAPPVRPTTVKKLFNDMLKLIERARKAGTILEMYYIPGYEKTVTIEEHNNAETLLQNLSGNPMADFIDWEVYPLAENYDELAKVFVKKFKAAG